MVRKAGNSGGGPGSPSFTVTKTLTESIGGEGRRDTNMTLSPPLAAEGTFLVLFL